MKFKFLLMMFLMFAMGNMQAAVVVPAAPQTQLQTEVQAEQVLPRQEARKAKKGKKKPAEAPAPKQTQGKSFLVAFLLFWFLGLLGIHRFYLGYNGMGILYLFTAAIFGIGWIIDLILFIVGGLPPKGKENYKDE